MSDYNVIQDLERRFLPSLHKMAEEISQELPNVEAKVYSYSVGSRTDYQGHDIGIDCLFSDATHNQVDNVALSISVRHLTTIPEFDSADVCWGHPSGYVEAELLQVPVAVNEDVLVKLEDGLEELYNALRAAIASGRPLDEQRWANAK
jgi:hypothetical protein